MAKKKQQIQNPPKPKTFHVSPFGALKGVAVLDVVDALPVITIAKKKYRGRS